ncbi:MAG TPA: metallopeptidase TldD-related protein [Chloroflexota bacterium]|nr:metallopeptidase TldD-related protein [Chloroflexota bacterium]
MTELRKSVAPQEMVERALAISRADGCIAIADEITTANLRWANNTLTTNGTTHGRRLTVIATVGGAQGTAAGVVSREGVTTASVEDLVRAAEDAARAGTPADDAAPLVTGTSASPNWGDPPARTSMAAFADFAPALGDAFARARHEDRVLYGYAEHNVVSTYLASSTGLRRRHDQPTGHVEINAKSSSYPASVWAAAAGSDFSEIDLNALEADVTQRLSWSQRRLDLPAGRYETLLPPSAVADFMLYMSWVASARDAQEGRTVFSKPGGGTRVGERLSDRPMTLRSDPSAPGLAVTPFVIARSSGPATSVFDNGLPLEPTAWIENGTLRSLVQTRRSAEMTGLDVTPRINNLILEGQGSLPSLPEMVGTTGRGLLLTSLFYIRQVDPQTLLLTGLTRDGVFLIDGGEVAGAVNNFRFNESPVSLLGRVSEIGATQHTLGRDFGPIARTAMPPLRIPDFNMSTVSQAS